MSITLNYHLAGRENNFDFIRFCAAAAVIFSHSYDLTGVLKQEPLRMFSHGYISIGTLSVVVFFIISGFLIRQSYDNSPGLKKYLVSRALRIYPALIVTVFLTVFLICPFITLASSSAYFSNPETYTYLLNCFAFRIYISLPQTFVYNPIPDLVNGCLWSLPYEISCYLLLAIYCQLKEVKLINVLLLAVGVAIIYFSIGLSYWGNILHYTFYFICGSLFYEYRSKIRLNVLAAVLCLILVFVIFNYSFNKHIKDVLLGLSLSYLILTFSYMKGALNHFSKWGDFSYGLYIWGFLVQQIVILYFPEFNSLNNFIVSFAITLIISFFSWHLIEKRMLKYKRHF